MNHKPVAGTFRLDGMLQGPLPPGSPLIEDMKAWVTSAKSAGLHFHPSAEGGGFSLLADPAVRKTSMIPKGGLDHLMTDALNAFLELLPEGARTSVYSTIRSEEFRPGGAVQTLYTVGPDGEIASEQRQVDIDTEDAPAELTAASMRRAILPALVVLLLGLFVSSFFIDYRKLYSEARDRVAPLDKGEVTVEQTALEGCIEVEITEADNRRHILRLRLKRGPAWEQAMQSAPSKVSNDWPTFLIHSAIHRGHLRVEFHGKDGGLLGIDEIRTDGLRETETATVTLGASLPGRLARIVIRP